MHNYVHGIRCNFTTAFKILNNYRLRELTPWNRALLEKNAGQDISHTGSEPKVHYGIHKPHHHYTDPDKPSSCPPK